MWVGLGNIMSVERSQDDKVCSTIVQFVHKMSYSGPTNTFLCVLVVYYARNAR